MAFTAPVFNLLADRFTFFSSGIPPGLFLVNAGVPCQLYVNSRDAEVVRIGMEMRVESIAISPLLYLPYDPLNISNFVFKITTGPWQANYPVLALLVQEIATVHLGFPNEYRTINVIPIDFTTLPVITPFWMA